MGIIKRLADSLRRSQSEDKPEATVEGEPEVKKPEAKKAKGRPNGDIRKRYNTTLQMMAVSADEAAARALEECENVKDESAKLTRQLSGAPDELKEHTGG